MSAPRADWIDRACQLAPSVLSRHRTIQGACDELSRTVGHLISANGLRNAFRLRRLPAPSSMLAGEARVAVPFVPAPFVAPPVQPPAAYVPALPVEPPLPPPDPVEVHRQKKDAKDLRASFKELVERLGEAEKRQKVLDALDRPVEILKVPRREKTSGLREATAVILASDWHVEETVDPVKVANRNEYNLEIADARIRRWGAGGQWLIGHHRESFKIRDVVGWFGGDLISGYIHEELVEQNALSPIEALIWLKPRLIREIDFHLSDPDIVTFWAVFSFGNHGRTTPKRRISSGAENSFEWLLYNWIADHYADNPRVKVVLDKSAHQYLDVYDFSLHFHHGDEVGYGGGVGGISIPLNKRIPKWESVRPSHYHHIGHFHQFIDLGRMMVNGSLIGYNPFAMSIGAGYEPPQQGSYLLDSKRGKTMVSPIWVDETAPTVEAA